mmetsp:Transcript_57672/g.159517  ORF Transcript_57672/g.159517 Transcript_57672/m.159517 type:complete len:157 (+) Transcript_57672:49-519(+)
MATRDAAVPELLGHLKYLTKETKLTAPPAEIPPVEVPVRFVETTWEFQVVLERQTTEDKFGITYRIAPDQTSLLVQTVKPSGICAKHNWEMQHFPVESQLHQQQVVVNDIITVVNGQNQPDAMKQELINSLEVHLHVRRLPVAEQEAIVMAPTVVD